MTPLAGCPDNQPAAAKSSQPANEPPTTAASTVSVVRDPGPAFEQFAMPGVQGLIVGEAEAGRFYAEITGGTSPGYWTPEKAQLIDLETRLPRYLSGHAPPTSNPRKNLRSYRRQYIGIMRDGRPTIFINFFCETRRQDWTRKPIVISDGGDCAFVLQFDPKKRAFSDLVLQKEG